MIRIRISDDDFLTDSVKIANGIEKEWYPCIVSIEQEWVSISEKQRKYYFGVVVPYVMEKQWEGKEATHLYLKSRFLPDYEELLQKIQWTTDIPDMLARFLSLHHDLTITEENTGSFEEYLSRIRQVYTDIPLPNE